MLSNINDQTIAMLLPDADRAGRGGRGIRRIALITADRSLGPPSVSRTDRAESGRPRGSTDSTTCAKSPENYL
jgi:hypothetical protein